MRKSGESLLQPKRCGLAAHSCLLVLLGAVSLPGAGQGVSHMPLALVTLGIVPGPR